MKIQNKALYFVFQRCLKALDYILATKYQMWWLVSYLVPIRVWWCSWKAKTVIHGVPFTYTILYLKYNTWCLLKVFTINFHFQALKKTNKIYTYYPSVCLQSWPQNHHFAVLFKYVVISVIPYIMHSINPTMHHELRTTDLLSFIYVTAVNGINKNNTSSFWKFSLMISYFSCLDPDIHGLSGQNPILISYHWFEKETENFSHYAFQWSADSCRNSLHGSRFDRLHRIFPVEFVMVNISD